MHLAGDLCTMGYRMVENGTRWYVIILLFLNNNSRTPILAGRRTGKISHIHARAVGQDRMDNTESQPDEANVM